jgi:predicted dehydrogenase
MSVESVHVVGIADVNENARARARRTYPGIPILATAADLLKSPEVDAIAVASPVWTHYEIAKAALENGKHVFVEKPFTSSVETGEQLINIAARRNLKIMVDHTFLFTDAVKKIAELVSQGTLGKLYYYDSMRVNLGLFQHDINVLWDLAPHDLAIMDYLTNQTPEAVVATGQSHLNGHEDIAFMTLYFPDALIAHINVNWLSPVKVRTTLIGGEHRMLVWNDLESDNKIKVYDKGVSIKNAEGVYDLLVKYRSGDMWAPHLDQSEALREELSYFAECITSDKEPFNNGQAGLRVVTILEAATKSLNERGAMVYL